MGQMVDTMMAYLDKANKPILMEIGVQSKLALELMLSTPYPPASSPGTPPHRRTGNLQAGAGWAITGPDTVTIFIEREGTPGAALDLEFGAHGLAARPFMRPLMLNSGVIIQLALTKAGA